MIQKIDNLKRGDLIVINDRPLHSQWNTAVFISANILKDLDNLVVSITYVSLYHQDRTERINTRNSTQQRVYKITEDNLTRPLLNSYKDILKNLGL